MDEFWKNYFGPHDASVLSLDVQRKIENLKTKYINEKNRRGLKQLDRFVRNQINSKRLTQSSVSIPDSMFMPPAGFDVGKLMAYGKASTSGGVSMGKVFRELSRFSELMSVPDYLQRKYHGHSMTEIYREQSRFQRMMNEPIGGSITIGDDDQYAFGADTGANRGGDFAYLAEQEKEQRERRASMRRAEARGSIRQKKERLHYMKEYPAFFKNSKQSTKDIRQIVRFLKKAEKIPLAGKFLKMAGANPYALAGMLGMGAIGAGINFLNTSDRANDKYINWLNSLNLYGKPTKAFTQAALKSGMKDPAEITKAYGSLYKWGPNPEKILGIISSAAKGQSGYVRSIIANKFGIDETTLAIADELSGNLQKDKARDVAARKSALEIKKTLGYTTGATVSETTRGLQLSVPGATSIEARHPGIGKDILGQASKLNSKGAITWTLFKLLPIVLDQISAVQGAENAARSADKFKAGEYSEGKQTKNGNTYVTINTGDLSLPNVTNGEEFAGSLTKEASKKSQRAEILTMFDSMEL